MSAFGGYSSTAVGGDDGGGFMWGSQGGSQSASKPINDESLRPVTIKQIIDAEPAYAGDASFRIDGLDVKQVTVVGMVRAINPQTTNITYKLDDGTGVVEVKQWLDADRAGDAGAGGGGALPTFDVGAYVRVWGRLKSFSNKRHIGAHVIKPVRDFNEVNYHLLEATYVHLFFTRGPLKPSSVPGGVGAGVGIGVGAGGHSDSMFVDDGGAGYRGSSSKAKTMYNYLQRSGNPTEGIHMQVIARATGMTVQDIMVAAEELLSHGTIYTTMDDETYAILDR
ncbi:putative replication factor A2 [Rosellinia necatrix]|uniref:Putative replication factor A2 n=1 Tax=Rosellinia necatrix TaxID=77044 RepID=A0A1W2TEE1_ROSNE|nr:putative replication factor A2 [Rosellinia necatrix]